jgi:hypothetical protein
VGRDERRPVSRRMRATRLSAVALRPCGRRPRRCDNTSPPTYGDMSCVNS